MFRVGNDLQNTTHTVLNARKQGDNCAAIHPPPLSRNQTWIDLPQKRKGAKERKKTFRLCPSPAAARFLFVVEVVNHLRLDSSVDIFCHGVANLFADVSHRSQGSPYERERLGDLPRESKIERDRADGASDVSGQRTAILSFRSLANPLEKIAIASIHARLPCDCEQTQRPGVGFRMRPMADSRYPFFPFGVLFHRCLRGVVEISW